MRLLLWGAALAALALAGCARQDPVRVVLAPGATRACTGEVQVTPEFVKDMPQLPPPQTNTLTQNFTATRVGGGYVFEQTGNTAIGNVTLRANVSENGEVLNAELTGNGLSPLTSGATSQDDINRLAMAAARNIPERIVVGRTIKVGDNLYPEALGQELAETMSATMALPPGFSINVDTDIPFKGARDIGGRSVLQFEGTMQVNGSGDQGGQQMTMALPSNITMSFDAETGLLRDTATDGVMTMTVDGERQAAMRLRQTMTCTISVG